MKKYLMTGIAALALCVGFTSCSQDLEMLSQDEINELEAQRIVNNYNKAFKAYIGGEIASTQTWGFGNPVGTRTRSGNTGAGYTSYPATHVYKDANGNVIAGANMNCNEWADPTKEFGGWEVPDALTEGQKLRVQKYFQANPRLTYQDPHYANFFVQQVYTGGTSAPETGNKESTVGADGQAHKGMTLNQLTVGTACSHINNFNAGTCTERDVLDNGQTVNGGTTHKDQITLMVNVDDTSCFGYHETSGSNVNPNNNHNDKMALVSAATIDAWAAQNGNPGEAVVDKWNRSFMGFDYELLPESDIVTDSYAMLSNWDGNLPEYAWDGTDVMVIGSAPEATEAEEVNITSTFAQNTTGNNVTCNYDSNGNIVCNFTGPYYNSIQFVQSNADWRSYDKLVIEFAEPSPIAATINANNGDVQIKVGDTKVEVPTPTYIYNNGGPTISCQRNGETNSLTLKIKSVKLVNEATAPDSSIKYYTSQYLLAGGTDQISFYSTNTNMYGGVIKNVTSDDMKTTVDGKTCINLKWIKEELLDKGYHPISTDLKKWVKWQAACDGYYSDWIVTLTQARRIGETPDPDPVIWSVRIMAEDLSANEASDFDFNDVVIDVDYTKGQSTATITLQAAGGTLPLIINDDEELEVHALFDVPTTTMVNTGWTGSNGANDVDPVSFTIPFTVTDLDGDEEITNNDFLMATNGITLKVRKTVPSTGDYEWIEMTARQGEPAAKFAVSTDCQWLTERTSIKSQVGSFAEWAQGKIGTLIWF